MYNNNNNNEQMNDVMDGAGLPEYFVLANNKYCPARFGHNKPVITQ